MPDIDDMAQKIAELQNAYQPFKDVNSGFSARDWLNSDLDDAALFPIAFLVFSKFWQSPKSTGVRGSGGPMMKQPRQLQFRQFHQFILVGYYNVNDIGRLTRESARYIEPLQRFYDEYWALGGMAEDLFLGEGEMRTYTFEGHDVWGLRVPIDIRFSTRHQVGR